MMKQAERAFAADAVGRLRVRWFDRWHDDLDAALQQLPEMETCPHELYREILQTSGPVPKRTALVTHQDSPVAVVGVRRDGARWTPVTSWIVPGVLFPVRPGYLVPVLTQMDVPLFIAWWRQQSEPPANPRFTQMNRVATRRLSLTGDYEAHWKATGLIKDIRVGRRKCAHLAVVVNAPGAIEWTIENWGRKWAAGHGTDEVPEMRDRLVVARYWVPRGRQFIVSLMEGERFAASAAVFVHDRHIIGQANYRDPAYDKLSIGARLFDAIHEWGGRAGFEKHDFGGGHDYKARWAPEEGARWDFVIEPVRSGVRERARAAWQRLFGRPSTVPATRAEP
jgi:hypothetical protein